MGFSGSCRKSHSVFLPDNSASGKAVSTVTEKERWRGLPRPHEPPNPEQPHGGDTMAPSQAMWGKDRLCPEKLTPCWEKRAGAPKPPTRSDGYRGGWLTLTLPVLASDTTRPFLGRGDGDTGPGARRAASPVQRRGKSLPVRSCSEPLEFTELQRPSCQSPFSS